MRRHAVAILLSLSMAVSNYALAQQAMTYRCQGSIGGVLSAAIIEVQPGGSYGGPYVAGRIQNNVAAYTFTGELFGGNEGYIALVDSRTGERIDRVWIGIANGGFALVTQEGTRYSFRCG